MDCVTSAHRGTPLCRAPEQKRAADPIFHPNSEIYSIAASFFELLDLPMNATSDKSKRSRDQPFIDHLHELIPCLKSMLCADPSARLPATALIQHDPLKQLTDQEVVDKLCSSLHCLDSLYLAQQPTATHSSADAVIAKFHRDCDRQYRHASAVREAGDPITLSRFIDMTEVCASIQKFQSFLELSLTLVLWYS